MKIENDMRERREALKLSRANVAEAAGCTVSAVYAAESGGMPRGGQAIIDKIEAVLRGEKGGVVSAETVFSVGDVVSGVVADEQLLLLLYRVGDDTVDGYELVQYDHDGMKKAAEVGASIHKHQGRNYVVFHFRSMRKSVITGHWPQKETPLIESVL